MVSREACAWLLMTAASSWSWAFAADDDGPIAPADAAVYRRIDQVRRSMARMRLDGSDRDWTGIPQIADPRGDAQGDESRDILAAAIAPTKEDLWIMVRTAGRPSTDPWAFYFEVDVAGEDEYDFLIGLESLRKGPTLRLYDAEKRPGTPVRLPRARLVMRQVVEMRVPYADIAAALPKDMADRVRGQKQRSWVRVRTSTWNGLKDEHADHGPMVASFRLIPTPYPLDDPLPKRPAPPVDIRLPVKGQWFVSQGAMGSFSHRGQWACDLLVLDRSGYNSTPKQSKNNADHHAWELPVVAPVDGRVLHVRSAMADVSDDNLVARRNAANYVSIATATGHRVELTHLRKDSVAVRPFDLVKTGQQIGRVGNSGYSNAPHLHIAAGQRFGGRTVPLAFTHVRVGLNPVPDDAWARDLERWEPRYGWFVGGDAGMMNDE